MHSHFFLFYFSPPQLLKIKRISETDFSSENVLPVSFASLVEPSAPKDVQEMIMMRKSKKWIPIILLWRVTCICLYQCAERFVLTNSSPEFPALAFLKHQLITTSRLVVSLPLFWGICGTYLTIMLCKKGKINPGKSKILYGIIFSTLK